MSAQRVVAIVSDLGTGESEMIYDDAFHPKLFGAEVESADRVTDVEFEGGEWVSRFKDGTVVCRGEDRSAIVREEHLILAQMMAEGKPIPGRAQPTTPASGGITTA